MSRDRHLLLTALLTFAVTVLAGLAGGTAAAADGPPGATAPGSWRWPLEPVPRVVRPFDAPAGPYGPGHRGVDLDAGVGQPVLAAGAGVVAFAGTVAGRGVVSVAHADGRRTTYEPVAAVVAGGEAVIAGAPLGTVTAAPGHCLPGTCLHWGLRLGDIYLDPLGLVGAVEVRLLPVWGDGAAALARPAPNSRIGVPVVPVAPVAGVSSDRGPLLARG